MQYLIIWFLGGMSVGVLICYTIFIRYLSKPDAVMIVNTKNPEKDVFKLEMNIPFGKIAEKSFLLMSVRNEDDM